MVNNKNKDNRYISTKQADLTAQMQDAWKKHVWWTREVILAIAHKLPGADVRVAKLLQNPAEMASHFAPYYSDKTINKMTDLFTTHLKQGGDIVTAAKAGDMQKVEDLTRQWYANADQIAQFYASVNPHYKESEVRAMMHEHLQLTLTEAAYEIQGKYQDSIKTFDQIQDEAAMMANYFAAGFIKQFPDKF